MRPVTARDLRELTEMEGGSLVTITMPAAATGADYDGDRIRFKNLLAEAEDELSSRGLRRRELDPLLEPARELEGERPYWKALTGGLALYLAPGHFRRYRLPFGPEAEVHVGERFETGPLVRLLARERRCLLLALGLGDNRLLEVTPYDITELPAAELPEGMSETLRYDVFERHLQGHATSWARTGARMTFHGHDSEKETRREKVRRYVEEVASGLSKMLAGERVPLVVAALPYILSVFERACDYPRLSPENIPVDPGHMRMGELHERAGGPLRRMAESDLRRTLESYGNAAASGRATGDVEEVVRASLEGGVETLLLSPGPGPVGDVDMEAGTINARPPAGPGDTDLADLAAEQTVLKGGSVLEVPIDRMPNRSRMAALLRYAR